MTIHSYLAGWELSATVCVAFSLIALLWLVPRLAEMTPILYHKEASSEKKIIAGKSQVSFKRTLHLILVTLRYGWRGLFLIAIAFEMLVFTAAQSFVNFIVHAHAVGYQSAFGEEISNGVLGVRLSSLIMLGAWFWSYHQFRRSDLNDDDRSTIEAPDLKADKIEDLEEKIRIKKMDNLTHLFKADNELKQGLTSLPHGILPRHVLQSHVLHVGFLASALLFSTVSIDTSSDETLQALLNWIISFATHDVGLAFSYAYMLKGRLLALHRVRVHLAYLVIVVLMILLIVPIFSLVISTLTFSEFSLAACIMLGSALFAIASLLGLWIFTRLTERYAQSFLQRQM